MDTVIKWMLDWSVRAILGLVIVRVVVMFAIDSFKFLKARWHE